MNLLRVFVSINNQNAFQNINIRNKNIQQHTTNHRVYFYQNIPTAILSLFSVSFTFCAFVFLFRFSFYETKSFPIRVLCTLSQGQNGDNRIEMN